MLRSKLITLPPALKTLTHHFLQRCTVSGTAKGKGKLKPGQALQRSKIPKKKGAQSTPGASSGGGGRGNEATQRLNNLVDSCINAPTPIRYLKPWQKKREAEREKMGLISKERQRELDLLKKKKKEEFNEIMGTPGLDLITLGLVDKEKIPKYELTVEDGKRLAKEYSRVLMRKHRARRAAESTLLKLKKEAIEALPEDLKEKALVPDLAPFPKDRFMATLTPPIEGYIDKIREEMARNSGKKKLR